MSTGNGGRAADAARRVREFLRHVERTYGLTPNEYRALYFAQGGRCYVCRTASGRARFLGVDHNHLTGEVRGLVCTGSRSANTCNRLIAIHGGDGANPARLARALELLGYAVTFEPFEPPARRVLVPMRAGETVLPFLHKPGTFDLREVRGVDLG